MKRFYLTPVAMGVSLILSAAVPDNTNVSTQVIGNAPVIFIDDSGQSLFPELNQTRQGLNLFRDVKTTSLQSYNHLPTRGETEPITITIKINDYEPNVQGDFSLIYALPDPEVSDTRPWGMMVGESQASIDNIIPGVAYDLFLCASGVNVSHVIIREGVVFDAENNSIEVSVKDASELIEMHSLNPDGSLMVLEKVENGVITQEGYATHQYVRSYMNKDWGQLGVLIGNIFRTREADGEISENNIAKVYCSPSSNFSVAQIDYAYDLENGWTTVFTAVDELKSTVLKSDPANYYTMKDAYAGSLYEYKNAFVGTSNEKDYDLVNGAGIMMDYVCNGKVYVTANMLMKGEEDEVLSNDVRMCYPPGGYGRHTAMASTIMVEDPYTMMFATGEILGCKTPMAMNTENGVVRYPFPAHSDWNALCDETGATIPPINNTISFVDKDVDSFGCHAAPIFDFRMYDYGFCNPMFQISYKGIYGEDRDIDCLAAEIHFLRDDEELWSDYRDISDFRYSTLSMENIRSNVDFSIINRNLTVDGMETVNEARLVYDESKDDYTPPTLTHLQYRSNKSDSKSNRFDDSADGIMQFYAGDFFPTSTDDGYATYYAEQAPATIKVEYAPYQKDEWKELSVTNDEELTLWPGFGHFYNTPLETITEKSDNGWFDLRITLADANENTITQRISPAFYIKNLSSGVESISDDSGIFVKDGRIIVPKGAVVYNMEGMITIGRTLTPGLYIVRHGEKAVKVMVK
jgi:hypothetical protein